MNSSSSDRRYHEDRAMAELMLAEAAADPSIAQVHRELAALHRRQLIIGLGEQDVVPPEAEQPAAISP